MIRKPGNKKAGMGTKKSIIFLFALAIIIFITYQPVLHNEFFNLDDNQYVIDNINVKSLDLENIKSIFDFTGVQSYLKSPVSKVTYVPLTIISFALEYHFYKLNPVIYHMTNIFLHILNVILIFWLTYVITGRFDISAITSILFSFHPLHVESVAWVTCRKDLLFSLFFFLSLIVYIYYIKTFNWFLYFFSLSFFFLSLLSKPMAVMLPVVLLLFDWFFKRRFNRKTYFDKIPFFLLSVFFSVIMGLIIKTSQSANASYFFQPLCFNPVQIIITSIYGLLLYFQKFVIPIGLSSFYPYPEKPLQQLNGVFIISPLMASLIATILFFVSKYSRKATFGILFFLITLVPVIFRLPPSIAADRFVYVSIFGFCYIIAGLIVFLYNMFDRNKGFSQGRKAFIAITVILLLIVIILANQRCYVWRNSLTVWNDVLKHYPDNPIAFYNRANHYLKIKDKDNAFNDYSRAIELNPLDYEAYNNRGILFYDMKENEKALSDQNKALEIRPDFAPSHTNKGDIYCRLGEYDKAFDSYARAITNNPYNFKAYNNRGVLYFELKEFKKAISDYTKALEIEPDNVRAIVNRGCAYSENGQYKEAIEDCNMGISIESQNPDLLNNRGMVYSRMGDQNSAIKDFTLAIRLNSNSPRYYYNRGFAYCQINLYDKALEDFNEAIKLDPGCREYFNNRGLIYFKKKNYDKALADFNMALKIDRDFSTVYLNRGNLYKEMQKYNEALSDFNNLIRIGPAYSEDVLTRGMLLIRTGRYKDAINDYTEVIKLNPDLKEAYKYRALAFLKIKDYNNASRDLKSLKDMGIEVDLKKLGKELQIP